MTGGQGESLRSPAARALILAALTLSLVLGTAFLVINAPHRGQPNVMGDATQLTDEQATRQVVDSAQQIVEVARLRSVSGSVVFLSCTSLHDPPYQAAVYLNFGLPETNSVKRIREIGAAMVANGWQQAPSMGEHFGLKLTKAGVTATFHENLDDPRFGAMRIYGECRNTSDHRNDNPAFTDISDRLR
jgi:hypothetical protein